MKQGEYYLIDLCPKPMFESFLSLLQGFSIFHQIKMSKDPHDPWKAMNLSDVQELKCLHLKPKTGIN